ncbi:hypothetical protein G210_0045 [Candida maltosa Xu316]|uniref:Uncharacterized protein n=1 Tax=Candida maltosa (strain Xu316) TaxID=1245528 RepID=M3IRU9_CANMX|nr:hypothetical protein G210_0045 [Candida maltosa Xu316]
MKLSSATFALLVASTALGESTTTATQVQTVTIIDSSCVEEGPTCTKHKTTTEPVSSSTSEVAVPTTSSTSEATTPTTSSTSEVTTPTSEATTLTVTSTTTPLTTSTVSPTTESTSTTTPILIPEPSTLTTQVTSTTTPIFLPEPTTTVNTDSGVTVLPLAHSAVNSTSSSASNFTSAAITPPVNTFAAAGAINQIQTGAAALMFGGVVALLL